MTLPRAANSCIWQQAPLCSPPSRRFLRTAWAQAYPTRPARFVGRLSAPAARRTPSAARLIAAMARRAARPALLGRKHAPASGTNHRHRSGRARA